MEFSYSLIFQNFFFLRKLRIDSFILVTKGNTVQMAQANGLALKTQICLHQ